MGKIIQVAEAARRLGVTDQTLRNWAAKGAINIKKVGKAHYVDEDTIDALSDTAEDIKRSRRLLEQLKEKQERETKEFMLMMHDKESRRRYYSLCVEKGMRTEFFATILEMMGQYGSLSVREVRVIKDRLFGDTLETIGQRYMLTRERVRQITEKAIRKAHELSWLKEKIDHIRDMETDMVTMKQTIANLSERLNKYEEQERRAATETEEEHRCTLAESDALCQLLTRKLTDCPFSVRSLNIMKHGLNCETLGDVCKLQKIDFLKARNAGKKSLIEVDDYLLSQNLEWGMDVDSIYQERVEILLSMEAERMKSDKNSEKPQELAEK